ncbi:MAG: LSU ribosomal protein L15p (L27Ae) [Candidatus Ozemobacter sibiricus]|jgi:large subunit ribosomal protein L15|uniref:Large ribosomal subunit protein uL15 n=1 Tax=Candidatus Ozemobacter sibiricus TaxID=2268124 RepID=A0A367ZKX1_9BACT|nr:MAG: LSU ribosomal protein L15p (L27Ae) [Candidatus Ozemobacter sibiricus]
MLTLGNLKKALGSTHRKKRIGRGKGSGHGNQSTRGGKGQTARSGKPHPYAGFEGGQMRLVRTLPKRGFISPHRVTYSLVNLGDLDKKFEANTVVTTELLCEKGLVKNLKHPVKILARGDISKALTVHAHRFSESAKAKIEKAGGKAEVI